MDSITNSEHNHSPPIVVPVVVFEVNTYFPLKLITLKFRLGYVLWEMGMAVHAHFIDLVWSYCT